MPIHRVMKGVPSDILAAEGLFSQDHEALTMCQRECIHRMTMTLQLEQEAYLSAHPELMAMMELFICHVAGEMKRKAEPVKQAADFFLRPVEDLDAEIRKQLGIGPEGPYAQPNKPVFNFHDDENLMNDLNAILKKHFPVDEFSEGSEGRPRSVTESSSFLSVRTSDTTLPTPEPIPTPEPTLSENMFTLVSNTVDKAVYSRLDDAGLRYDTAYVELSKAVEAAMEIPVIEIRVDIAMLLHEAYKMFEMNIMEKERVAAEAAWEKRMRKKMKRTLRRQDNFKGFETPQEDITTPSTKSTVSNPSYLIPPPRPCICHPKWNYNRYAKDRFGIYLPSVEKDEAYDGANVTATPVISQDSLQEEAGGDDNASMSSKTSKTSRKSTVSTKSVVSQKRATKYQYTN